MQYAECPYDNYTYFERHEREQERRRRLLEEEDEGDDRGTESSDS